MAANLSIARRYAKALAEVAAEASQLDKVGAELSTFVAAYSENKELTETLENPAYERAQKLKLVEELGKAMALSPMVANLLALLVERNRISIIVDVNRLYGDLADSRSGRVRSRVTSAVALPDETVKRLEQSLAKMTQRAVVMETKVDPELIGGISAQVGSVVIDGSVRHQLELLRRELRGG